MDHVFGYWLQQLVDKNHGYCLCNFSDKIMEHQFRTNMFGKKNVNNSDLSCHEFYRI